MLEKAAKGSFELPSSMNMEKADRTMVVQLASWSASRTNFAMTPSHVAGFMARDGSAAMISRADAVLPLIKSAAIFSPIELDTLLFVCTFIFIFQVEPLA
jgi:hypothetical protein